MDEGLPTPSYHEIINRGYIMAYALEGYFGTQKGQEYLNDIIARVLLTFSDLKPLRLNYEPNITDYGTYLPKIYKLKELQALKSLQTRKKIPQRADSYQDIIFWAIKLYCEDLIRAQGIVSYEQLESFALDNFISRKDQSTLRAKCRSIWNYYEEKEWKLNSYKKKPKGEVMATREEHIAKVNQNKIRKNQNKIKAVIEDVFLQDEIRFKNGKYRVGVIAEMAGLTEKTVSKHLKEMELI